MSEKAYKTMTGAGATNIVLGILAIVTGVVTGVLLIVQGGRLLKNKSGLTFQARPGFVSLNAAEIFIKEVLDIGNQNGKKNPPDRSSFVSAVPSGSCVPYVLF